MQLNIEKLQQILLSIDDISFVKQRDWDKTYYHIENKNLLDVPPFCCNYNDKIWNSLLNKFPNQGGALDIYEFNNIFNTLSHSDVKIIFNKINIKSKCIQYDEFDDFLCHIDEKKYLEILSCLESESINEDFIHHEKKNDVEAEPINEDVIHNDSKKNWCYKLYKLFIHNSS